MCGIDESSTENIAEKWMGLVYSHWKLGGRIIVGAGDYGSSSALSSVKSHVCSLEFGCHKSGREGLLRFLYQAYER